VFRYKERALDLQAKITNQPFTPKEFFVKHVEFAERFDVTKDLELDSADDSFIEQFNLDIFGLIILFVVLSGLLLYTLWRSLICCFGLVSRSFNGSEIPNSKKDN
jgi:hypothetical protein